MYGNARKDQESKVLGRGFECDLGGMRLEGFVVCRRDKHILKHLGLSNGIARFMMCVPVVVQRLSRLARGRRILIWFRSKAVNSCRRLCGFALV